MGSVSFLRRCGTGDQSQGHSTAEKHPQPFFIFNFETLSPSIAEPGLELMILLPQLPESLGLQVGTCKQYDLNYIFQMSKKSLEKKRGS